MMEVEICFACIVLVQSIFYGLNLHEFPLCCFGGIRLHPKK